MATTAKRLKSPQELLDLVNKYDCFVFDCDGTLWRGSEVLEGIHEALDWLRALGKDVLFVTNNSMRSRADYAAKFSKLGLEAAEAEIYSSAYSAASYLKSLGFNKKAYVVGEKGILDELQGAGIACLGGPQDNNKGVDFSGEDLVFDKEVGAVVCGVDPGLSYYKVAYASMCILQNPGCLFVATNADARGHFTPRQEWPGAGATVGAIKAVVECEPILTGKPAVFMLEEIIATHGCHPDCMLMVGDRLDTDIVWGQSTGMDTLLVMTGVTDESLLNSPDNSIHPTYVMESFGDIIAAKAGQRAELG